MMNYKQGSSGIHLIVSSQRGRRSVSEIIKQYLKKIHIIVKQILISLIKV